MSILTLFKFQVLVLGASYLLHFVYCTNWAAWNWQVSKSMVWWTMLIVPILGVLASCTLGECLTLLFTYRVFHCKPRKNLTIKTTYCKKIYFHGISNLLCKKAKFKYIHTCAYYRIYFNPNISRHNKFTHTQPHAWWIQSCSFASGNGGIVNFHDL